MGRLRSGLRGAGNFAADWKNGATLLASVLVALLAVTVIDGIRARGDVLEQARQDAATAQATANQARSAQQAATRRIDRLTTGQQQLGRQVAFLLEENSALRQQVRDMGGAPIVITPSSSTTARYPSASPSPSPSPRQSPRPSPAPRPSPSPSPTCRPLPIIGCR